MKVMVIADTDGADLVFRVVSVDHGVSQVYRLPGQAERIAFNPYMVYGDLAARFVGASKFDLSIIVAHVRSGNLVEGGK